jgi:hypothetical protein
MNKFKYLSVVLFIAALAGVVISCDNESDVDLRAEGKKAGIEICDCVASFEAPNPENFDGGAEGESFQAAFGFYVMQLATCPGLLGKYQQYVVFVYENYNPEAENPLYSVFDFKNADFEAGFKEGTSNCMETFAVLFALIGGR